MSEWSNAADSDAQRRAFAEIRAEPSVLVISDVTGKRFWARCSRCGWRSTSHADKTQPGIHARHHEDGECGTQ